MKSFDLEFFARFLSSEMEFLFLARVILADDMNLIQPRDGLPPSFPLIRAFSNRF